VIRREGAAAAGIAEQLDGSFLSAVSLLLGCRGKVVVAGSGTSGTVARRMAHLLSVCGTPAFFLHPMDALHGSLGAVSGTDVVIAISKGGGSAELNDFARRAQERGAGLLSLTPARTPSSAGSRDVSVRIAPAVQADPGEVIAMAARWPCRPGATPWPSP